MKKALLPIMVCSWSIYYILCDYIIDIVGSPYLTGLLFRTITFIILTIFLLFINKTSFKFENKKSLILIALIGFLAFVFDCLINVGLKHSTATAGTALLKTEMIFVLVLNFFLGKKKIGLTEGFLAFFMACGSFLIVMGDWDCFSVDWWSFLFVLSALLNTICAYSIKKIQEKYTVSSYQIAYINNIISLIMYFVMVVAFGGVAWNTSLSNVGLSVSVMIILCGVCQATLMLTYYTALGRYEVWIVKTVLLIIPLFTLFGDFVLQGTYVTSFQFAGIIITITTALLMILKDKKAKKSK